MSQHLPALMGNSQVNLKAVCDADASRAERAAAISRCAYHAADYRQILDDGEIEAVIVCTPPWITPVITKAALAAGKDVLCEKPMALSLAEAEEVAAVEAESGRLLQVGFTYRHGPLMDALHNWIAAGRLGSPLLFRLSVFDEVWDPEGNPEHYSRIFDTLKHGAPCIHDGAHMADHLAFLTGSVPVEVRAMGLKSRDEFPAANYNCAWISFANGDRAKVEIGWFYPHFPGDEFQIVGPRGFAYLDKKQNEAVLMEGSRVERVQLNEDRIRNGFKVQLAKFLACIRTRSVPVPGSREGIASLRLTQAIARAMEEGVSVDVKEERI
jgi:predicted dehydrogenase